MKVEDFPLALKVKDAAQILNVSINKAYDMVREGRIPHIKDGARIIIPRDLLFRWMNEKALGAASGE